MRIGILLPKYNSNQLAYEAITSINQDIVSNVKDDYVLFYENVSPFCITPLCAAMTPDEMCLYNDGVLISTNFDNLESTIRTINTSKKILYLGDIEWLRPGYKRTYKQNVDILDGVRLICRSESHKNILENYCDRPVEVMSKFDIPRIARGN